MYNSSRNWIRLGALALGLAVPFMAATAQTLPYQEPIGSVKTCDANGVTDVQSPTYKAIISHEGSGTFETIRHTLNGTELRALDVRGSGNDPVLGRVEWSADIARSDAQGLVTTITANQAATAFPATGTFTFHARLTAGDVVYETVSPVKMTATLNEWPHNRAQYTSTGPVVYARVDNPQQTVTTPMMNATVTAQNANAGVAAPYQTPVGTTNTCDATGSTTAIVNGEVRDIPFSGGFGTFVTESTSDLPTPTKSCRALQLIAPGNDPVLGEFTFSVDVARTDAEGLLTTISADQADAFFPATGTFRFYGLLTVSAEGEQGVYRSRGPIIMTAKLSEWPHNHARYSSVGEVVYENVNDPSQTITTPKMDATVTAQ